MRLVVDRIEDQIVVCEDLETKEIKEIPLKDLPFSVNDGSIISYQDNKYQKEMTLEEERRRNLQARFNRLKKN